MQEEAINCPAQGPCQAGFFTNCPVPEDSRPAGPAKCTDVAVAPRSPRKAKRTERKPSGQLVIRKSSRVKTVLRHHRTELPHQQNIKVRTGFCGTHHMTLPSPLTFACAQRIGTIWIISRCVHSTQIPTNALRKEEEACGKERGGSLRVGLSLKGRGGEDSASPACTGTDSRSGLTVCKPSPGAVHSFILSPSELCPNQPKRTAPAPTYADHIAGAPAVQWTTVWRGVGHQASSHQTPTEKGKEEKVLKLL